MRNFVGPEIRMNPPLFQLFLVRPENSFDSRESQMSTRTPPRADDVDPAAERFGGGGSFIRSDRKQSDRVVPLPI